MDSVLEDAINGLAGHSGLLDTTMKLAAKDLIFLLALVAPVLWFWPAAAGQRSLNQRIALATCAAVLIAVVTGMIAGHLHQDARPFVTDADTLRLISHSADNGFPSDHATAAFAIGGAI